MTKKARILELWDGGARDRRAIAQEVGSTLNGVVVVLSQAGRLAGRMHNGPDPVKAPAILKLWENGERDLDVITRAVGSASRASVYGTLWKYGINPTQDGSGRVFKRFGAHLCRVPLLLAEEAERRGVKPGVFAQRLLLAIEKDEIYDAVLDGD